MRRRLIGVVVLVSLAVAGTALVVSRKRALRSLRAPAAEPIPVRVAAVREGGVTEGIRTVALVQAETATTIAAQAGGLLVDVRVKEGDRVDRGEVLARIDARTLDDAVAVARARMAAATEDLARQEAVAGRDEALFAGKAIARQALDASRAQLEGARATEVAARRGLETAQTARGYADVTAPYAGVITARMVEPGDLASPGKPLFAMQGTGKIKLVSKLSQSSLASVSPGTVVVFQSGGKHLPGRVTRVFPALDAARLGSVETVFPEAPFGLPSGAVVAATYEARPLRGLVVPVLALLEGMQETMVVRVKDGRAEPIPVTIAARGRLEAIVQGALAVGDTLVTGLPSELMSLTAGTSLRPVATPAAAQEGRP